MATPRKRTPAKRTGAKTRKTVQRRTRAAAPEVIVLAPNDLSGLKARYDQLTQQRAMTQMLEESYQGFLQGLRDQYALPEMFNVNWSNGVITAMEMPEDPAAQAS
jgi:hypothetical protein